MLEGIENFIEILVWLNPSYIGNIFCLVILSRNMHSQGNKRPTASAHSGNCYAADQKTGKGSLWIETSVGLRGIWSRSPCVK